jgi:hypothetical protein
MSDRHQRLSLAGKTSISINTRAMKEWNSLSWMMAGFMAATMIMPAWAIGGPIISVNLSNLVPHALRGNLPVALCATGRGASGTAFHAERGTRFSLSLHGWWPDARKFPQGLQPLIERVNALGMDFGLWVELCLSHLPAGPSHPAPALSVRVGANGALQCGRLYRDSGGRGVDV